MSRPPQYWLLDRLLFKKRTTVPFVFPKISSAGLPPPILGAVLVYLRLLTPCTFGPIPGMQRASNVVAIPVKVT